jgi:hypothetical protein
MPMNNQLEAIKESERLEQVIQKVKELNDLGCRLPEIISCPYCYLSLIITQQCGCGWRAHP